MSMSLEARAIESEHASLPRGDEERFAGWGVMGMPFASGHILAFRRFSASSIGPGYFAVWHRDPTGLWQMWQTVQPDLACPRYFSAALDRSHVRDIEVGWDGPREVTIRITGTLEWTLDIGQTIATRAMNTMMALLPESAWRSPSVLRFMGPVAGAVLGLGHVALEGRTPNGQRFRTGPHRIWTVRDAAAALYGQDLGPPGRLAEQGRLGDFWIPQQGVVAMGRSWFDLPDDSHLGRRGSSRPRVTTLLSGSQSERLRGGARRAPPGVR